MSARWLPLALCAACGTWSNEDFEYVLSVPAGQSVRSNLGSSSGESDGFEQTRRAAEDMNAIPGQVLGMLETLRPIPPTTRTAASRIWGPYADGERAAYENQAEIRRETETLYTWEIKTRRAGERFTTVASGDAFTSGDGRFLLELPDVRLEVGYATKRDPVVVTVQARTVDGGSVDYAYNGWRDGSGGLRFAFPDAGVAASWSPAGGRLDVPPWLACWDARRTATYVRLPTDAGIHEAGDPRRCIAPRPLAGAP